MSRLSIPLMGFWLLFFRHIRTPKLSIPLMGFGPFKDRLNIVPEITFNSPDGILAMNGSWTGLLLLSIPLMGFRLSR